MLLAHYWNSRGVMEFDMLTGAVGPKLQVSRESAAWGFLWRQRGKWFAIRKDHESLILQHGAKQWRLNGEYEFSVKRGFFRQFKIRSAGEVVFSFNYFFKGPIYAYIDFTYDFLDEEHDDFFIYVTERWMRWQDKGDSAWIEVIKNVGRLEP